MLQYLFSRSLTFAEAAELADADGIKESIATATSAATYSGVDLDGTSTVGVVGSQTFERLASWPTVSASSAAGAYTDESAVTFTGTWGGEIVTRTATIAGTDGNATFTADGPLDLGSVTSISVEAHADTDGAFTFGWSGVGPRKGRSWILIAREDVDAGELDVEFSNGQQDPNLSLTSGETLGAFVTRVLATTTVDFTAYE